MIRSGDSPPSHPSQPSSFGDRVRLSRQRLRTPVGGRWTQGDLAGAVGVERNTVSRWENGGILPKDPTVLAALARTLRVSADWLLGGFTPPSAHGRGSARPPVKERTATGYRLDAAALAALPPAAADLVRGYLERLSGAGCSMDQIRGAESVLLAGATNSVSQRPFPERTDAQVLADVDAAWDFVTQVLRREGIRP